MARKYRTTLSKLCTPNLNTLKSVQKNNRSTKFPEKQPQYIAFFPTRIIYISANNTSSGSGFPCINKSVIQS
jgi:hypothetical protein